MFLEDPFLRGLAAAVSSGTSLVPSPLVWCCVEVSTLRFVLCDSFRSGQDQETSVWIECRGFEVLRRGSLLCSKKEECFSAP